MGGTKEIHLLLKGVTGRPGCSQSHSETAAEAERKAYAEHSLFTAIRHVPDCSDAVWKVGETFLWDYPSFWAAKQRAQKRATWGAWIKSHNRAFKKARSLCNIRQCWIAKLDWLWGSLSAGHLGRSVSSGRFNSAYCGSLNMELRARLVSASGWFKPVCQWKKSALWMSWLAARVY